MRKFKFIYYPKMDIDQLINNLGGTIGLWFGFSALSIANFNQLKNYTIQLIKSLFPIFWLLTLSVPDIYY